MVIVTITWLLHLDQWFTCRYNHWIILSVVYHCACQTMCMSLPYFKWNLQFLECSTLSRSYSTLWYHLPHFFLKANTIFTGLLTDILTTCPARCTRPVPTTFGILCSLKSWTSSWFMLFFHTLSTGKDGPSTRRLKFQSTCNSSYDHREPALSPSCTAIG